jgi:hypothetical protein
MKIEQIVRPFQATAVFGARRIVSSSVLVEVREAGITWGVAGPMPTPVESPEPGPVPPFDIRVKGLNQRNIQQPAKDVLERVKIQQEGNPDNFVVVERLKKATFKDPKPRYLTSPSEPVKSAPGAPIGPTTYAPGPGIPGSEGTPMPNSMGTETVAPAGWAGVEVPMQGPRGDAIPYNAAVIRARAAAAAPPPVKFDTHEYEFTYPPPGPNETPMP